jgi:hypothetical protein
MKMPLSCGIDDWPGYISKEILEILVKYEILLNLDFMIQVCVDCIKGKQTKYTKNCSTRSGGFIEIVHRDICRPFDFPSFGRHFLGWAIHPLRGWLDQ